MPAVKRQKPVRPRKVTNDVGAAVTSDQVVLPPFDLIPVEVRVWWDDDADPELVHGMCLGWTREHVHVEVTDRLTTYKYRAWVPAGHVTRLLI